MNKIYENIEKNSYISMLSPYFLLTYLLFRRLHEAFSSPEQEDSTKEDEKKTPFDKSYQELVRAAIQQNNNHLQHIDTREKARIVLKELLQSAQKSIYLYLSHIPDGTELNMKHILSSAKSNGISVKIVADNVEASDIEKFRLLGAEIKHLPQPQKLSYFAIVDDARFILKSKEHEGVYIICLFAASDEDIDTLTYMQDSFRHLWNMQTDKC